MTNAKAVLRICCWGSFRLFDAQGHRLELPSRKGMAMLAMLATAANGERTRSWLQDRLWGSRGMEQAQQSLRRELSTLKAALPPEAAALITADRERVRLSLLQCHIAEDGRESGAQFLEGIDIRGEDGFEEWLREQRQRINDTAIAFAPPKPLPVSVVNARQSVRGFGGRPAIAILPFANATGDHDGEFWAEGIAEELSERMARLRWIPVIASATLAELKPQNLDALTIGNLVGAAYVLRGRLLRRGEGLTAQLSLLDGATGRMLWSERLTLAQGITPLALEEISSQLVAQLDALIDTEQQVRAINRSVEDLDFNELVWRARWHLNRLTREDAETARGLLERALAEQPNSIEALIQAGFSKAWEIWSGRLDSTAIVDMRSLAQRAIAVDGFDARGHMLAGMAEMWSRNHDVADAFFDEALRLNPSLARGYAQKGSNLYLSGRPEEALDPLRVALRLSPLDNQVFYVLGEIAMCCCMTGQWSEAIRHANLSIARRPAYSYAHAIKINAMARQGNVSAAGRALAALYRSKPGFIPADLDWLPFRDRHWNEYLKAGIALAEPA